MKKVKHDFDDIAITKFRERWASKQGKIKMFDVLQDIVRDKELDSDAKENCLEFVASLVHEELSEKDITDIFSSIKTVIKANNEKYQTEGKAAKLEPVNTRSVTRLIRKELSPEQFNAVKNQDDIDTLGSALILAFQKAERGVFLDKGDNKFLKTAFQKGQELISDEKSRSALIRSVKRQCSEKRIPSQKITFMLEEIEKNITLSRPDSPVDLNIKKD